MNDVELIRYLRAVANYGTCLTANDKEALALAADRLEDLNERVAIMMADMDNEWGKSY